MIQLYQLAGCPFALRTRIVLEEKKLPYQTTFIDRNNKPREVLEVSPSGATPVIYDGADKVRDSAIINEYLEEKHPEVPLMPGSAAGRAAVRTAVDDMDDLLEAMGEVFQARRKGEPTIDAVANLRAALGPWDVRLAKADFLVGSAYSIADVTLFAHLAGYAKIAGEPIPAALANLDRWMSRVGTRPAVAKAQQGVPA